MPVRWMSEIDAREFLGGQAEGRLATCSEAGEPYITPLNFRYREGKIYFHSKLIGKKLDNIAGNRRVCFETSAVEKITVSYDRPCACATRYTSVLAFGTARLISDDAEKTVLLNLLVEKYSGGKAFEPVVERHAADCAVVEIRIDEISGKMNVDPQ